MTPLEILLEKRWIVKNTDKEMYYYVKDGINSYRKFISEKLGFGIIITPNLIKLEKIPGSVNDYIGLPDFNNKIEYIFLCILLMFLEDKGNEEQFVLSGLTDYIEANYMEQNLLDWTIYSNRKALIKVLKFATDEGILKVTDGEVNDFADSETMEVLYENTGLSRYLMRQFSVDIMHYNSYKDFEKNIETELDEDRGIIRRQRVYRRLLLEPMVYNEGVNDQDYAYIKSYRKQIIQPDFEKYLEVELHVHKNASFIILPEDTNFKDVFPSGKNISDIVLQVCTYIQDLIKSKEIETNIEDIIYLSYDKFSNIIQKVQEKYMSGWSKTYRELSMNKLEKEVVEYMKSFSMIKHIKAYNDILIYPIVGKLKGDYPRQYWKKLEGNNDDK